MAKPWVGDGVTPAETDAIFGFRWMPRYADGLVEQVLVLPWTQDGITAAEGKAITYIYINGLYSRELADRLMQKLWLQDGVTADEARVIQYLYWALRVPDETQQPAAIEATIQILNMPFLETGCWSGCGGATLIGKVGGCRSGRAVGCDVPSQSCRRYHG